MGKSVSKDAVRFVRRVEEYREAHGLDGNQIASYLGIKSHDYSKWKGKQQQSPQVPAIVKFSQLARVPLSVCLEEAGYWPEDVPVQEKAPKLSASALRIAEVYEKAKGAPELRRLFEEVVGTAEMLLQYRDAEVGSEAASSRLERRVRAAG